MRNFRFKVIKLDFQRQYGTRKAELVPTEDLFVTVCVDTGEDNFTEDGDLTASGLGEMFENLEISLIASTDF